MVHARVYFQLILSTKAEVGKPLGIYTTTKILRRPLIKFAHHTPTPTCLEKEYPGGPRERLILSPRNLGKRRPANGKTNKLY